MQPFFINNINRTITSLPVRERLGRFICSINKPRIGRIITIYSLFYGMIAIVF